MIAHTLRTPSRCYALAACALATMLALACGPGGVLLDEPIAPGTPGRTSQGVAAEPLAPGSRIAVSTVDYAFGGLPRTVPVDSVIVLRNSSQTELHEFVVLRIPDRERRRVAELMALPEDELAAVFTNAPSTVILAPPMSAGVAVVGDGQLREPGQYAVVCFIPVGADPAAYLAAARAGNGRPPEDPAGPLHVARGMFAELVVR